MFLGKKFVSCMSAICIGHHNFLTVCFIFNVLVGKMILKMGTIIIVSLSMNHLFPNATILEGLPTTVSLSPPLWLDKGSTR